MKTTLTLGVICFVIINLTLNLPQAEAGFRCGWLGFLGNDRACRSGCWLAGNITGYCQGSDCICGSRGPNDSKRPTTVPSNKVTKVHDATRKVMIPATTTLPPDDDQLIIFDNTDDLY
eukprot:maker-scaffold481_size160081-snap-gene-0.13 protein:Tk12152 transcript:maker-scaffold481_size160081-snap-gene-0.13-mRNA-1 annotation:"MULTISPECIES: hypothetical protein"